MNNIYLTNNKNFAYTNSEVALPFVVADGLVDGWVKKYSLVDNQTKDFTTEFNNSRYRVHLFHSFRGWNAALRLLPSKILTFDELGVKKDDVLSVSSGSGLTLFCGPTGAGKSTTMNTVINSLLESGELGVTETIEDPIEYLHNKNIIFQREIGKDTASFSQGLIEAVRSNPQTIVIGEIRDSTTALEVVRAGLNGHRVFATLHASSVKEAIARLWSFLDDQGDELLVQSLQGIIAQHLININDKKVCIYESLKIDDKVKNILNQVLKKANDGSLNLLNHEFYFQKRKILSDKKQELIKQGVSACLLLSIK